MRGCTVQPRAQRHYDGQIEVVAAGGIIANIGVHGVKVDLHLERLWSHNVTITTRLVDIAATPMLLRTVQAGKIDPKRLITHHFIHQGPSPEAPSGPPMRDVSDLPAVSGREKLPTLEHAARSATMAKAAMSFMITFPGRS
jgi:hypothetical protein